jgi:hypothetical protein
LYSIVYKALQPITRWVQRNQSYKEELKESRNKKQHTPTHKKGRKEGGDYEKNPRDN